MSTTTDVRGPATTTPPAAPPEPKRRRPKGWWLPFLLLLPAILFELLIHVVPMLTGIWISFTQLTKFFIANWGEAPFVGFKNYTVALDFTSSIGSGLYKSFFVTVGFTILVVGLSWVLGMSAAVALQGRFRGRSFFRTLFLVPYALPLYAGII